MSGNVSLHFSRATASPSRGKDHDQERQQPFENTKAQLDRKALGHLGPHAKEEKKLQQRAHSRAKEALPLPLIGRKTQIMEVNETQPNHDQS